MKTPAFLRTHAWLLGLSLALFLTTGCQTNLVVRHRSLRASQPIHVYIDRALVCVVAPQKECKKQLTPGRHAFYAEVKGNTQHRWGNKLNPTPFAIDKQTVINLHDVGTPPMLPKPRNLPVGVGSNTPDRRIRASE